MNNKILYLVPLFLIITCSQICFAQDTTALNNQDFYKISLRDTVNSLSQIRNELHLQQQKAKSLLIQSEHNFELASKIIDWSAMIFTTLAILLIIAGGIGIKEFTDLRKTEKNLRETLTEIKTELSEIQNYRADIIKETKNFIEVNYCLNAGIQSYQSGDYFTATDHLHNVINLDPNHLEALFYIGKSLMMEYEEENANSIFERILEIDPKYSDAYYGLALNCSDSDPEKAINYCKKAVECKPKHVYALNFLGLIYAGIGNIDKALEVHKRSRLIKENPGNSFSIALIYYAIGEIEKAKKCFAESNYLAQKRVERLSQSHWHFYMMGVVEGLFGKMTKAKELINKALEYNSSKRIRKGMKKNLIFLVDNVKNVRDKKNIESLMSCLGKDI